MSFAMEEMPHGVVGKGLKPGEVSTGTSILVIPFEGGVVLGADTRVSTGSYVANRISDKIVQITPHIFCCRSGSAADTQALTDYCRYFLSHLSVETGRPVLVKTAAHMLSRFTYQNKERLLASTIIGGWDPVEGGQVYSISITGLLTKMPFVASGSGSTYIAGLMDAEFRTNIGQTEARTLVKKALAHAMARDGGSGGCIRTVVVTEEGNDRDVVPGNQLPYGPAGW